MRHREPTGRRAPAGHRLTCSVIDSAVQSPAITLDKTADTASFDAAGTLVTYSYLATNTGNVTLNPVTVTDPMSGLSTIDCPATSLAPQASETCHATYTTTGGRRERRVDQQHRHRDGHPAGRGPQPG